MIFQEYTDIRRMYGTYIIYKEPLYEGHLEQAHLSIKDTTDCPVHTDLYKLPLN